MIHIKNIWSLKTPRPTHVQCLLLGQKSNKLNDRQNLPKAINNLFTQNTQVHDYDTKQKEVLHPDNIIT